MTKALLIIDMINDFTHPKGVLYIKNSKKVVKRLESLLGRARANNYHVIYVNDLHTPEDLEIKLSCFKPHAMNSWGISWGSYINTYLSCKRNEPIIYKHFYSAFTDTVLDTLLKSLEIDTLIITGLVTNICISHTCYDAYTKGYKLIVVSDCTATINEMIHKDTLLNIKDLYGAKIVKSKDVFK